MGRLESSNFLKENATEDVFPIISKTLTTVVFLTFPKKCTK